MKNAISTREIGFIVLGIVLYMQNWLILQGNLWGYVDEIVALACIAYYLLHKIPKSDKTILSLIVITLIAGLSFNVLFGIQKHATAIVEDVISMYKFIFVYLGMKTYLEKKGIYILRIINVLAIVLKVYLFIIFVCALLNLLTDIGMSSEIRYGLRNFAFIYGTPGHVINQMAYSLLILHADREYRKKSNAVWILISIAVMLSTLKTRAIILVFLYFSLYYFFMLRKRKHIGLEIAIVAVAIGLIGAFQFEYYFAREGTPRQMFVAGAIKLVKEYFPFGAGFATYGSSAAADFYSPLYYSLGFSNRWGMTEVEPQFLNDNYLPMVFGEFGLIVASIFLILIYKYCREILKRSARSQSANVRLMSYFFVGVIILSSIQSSYLAHYSIVALSFFYFLFFNQNKRMKYDN